MFFMKAHLEGDMPELFFIFVIILLFDSIYISEATSVTPSNIKGNTTLQYLENTKKNKIYSSSAFDLFVNLIANCSHNSGSMVSNILS